MKRDAGSGGAAGSERTVVVLSQFPPPFGGLSVHSERLCATLEARAWRVQRLSLPPPPGPERRRFRRLRIVRDQLRFLARLVREPGALVHDHISTYWVGPPRGIETVWALARLAALRLRGGRWVITCGKGLLPASLAACPPWLRRAYRWLYAGASYGIAKNERILEAFEALGLGGRATVIGTFLEPVRPARGRRLPDDVEGFLAAHPVCVVTAAFQFEPLYHLPEVVGALDFVRRNARGRGIEGEVGLVVLASRIARPEGLAAFEAELARTGLGPHVLTLRDVDNALEVLERGAAFVRATDADGDANTVKEAMMVGVPVLATDLPGRPPGIELLARSELAALGPRLLELLAAPDPARVAANREYVRGDIERNAEAILGVYARVCGA
jgi:glycosyltransferase involved in cell wall biosynthesis